MVRQKTPATLRLVSVCVYQEYEKQFLLGPFLKIICRSSKMLKLRLGKVWTVKTLSMAVSIMLCLCPSVNLVWILWISLKYTAVQDFPVKCEFPKYKASWKKQISLAILQMGKKLKKNLNNGVFNFDRLKITFYFLIWKLLSFLPYIQIDNNFKTNYFKLKFFN